MSVQAMRHCQLPIGLLTLALCLLAGGADAWAQRIALTPVETGATWESVPVGQADLHWVPQVEQAPVVDGLLDDAAWQQEGSAPVVLAALQGVLAGTGDWGRLWFLADTTHLYIGARLAKPEGELRASVREPGGRVWTDDCLELFFLLGSGRQVQLDINALGTWWAGSRTAGAPWHPAPMIATVISEQHWTLELALPLSDLGLRSPRPLALAAEARYLVKNQSGWAAWRGVSDPARYVRLTTNRDHADGRFLQVRRYQLPARAAADRVSAVVEMHNPTGTARLARIRLLDSTAAAVALATEHREIPPGQTMALPLAASLEPERNYRLTLLAQDASLGQGWTFRRDQQVATLPALSLQLDRAMAWAGDAELRGRLDIGLSAAEREQGELTLLLARPYEKLHHVIVPRDGDQYRLRLALAGMEPGRYELVAHWQGAQRELFSRADLEVRPAAPVQARKQVPVRIDWTAAPAEGTAPVHVGLALPGGLMRDVESLRVLAGGVPIAAEFEPLTRWSPDGSIRWLAARFMARPGTDYSVELLSDRPAPTPPVTVSVEEARDGFVIDTGVARWEIPRQGPLLGRAWLGQTLVLQGGRGVLTITGSEGEVADERGGGADEAPVIESRGALQVVVRREGFYRNRSGLVRGKYVVRMTFNAGQASLPMQHTFIHTRSTDHAQYRDIAVTLQPAFGGPWEASFAWPGAPEDTVQVDPQSGEAVAMAQLRYDHHGQRDRQAAVLRREAGESAWQQAHVGEQAGNWGAAAGADAGVGVGVSVRWLWQTFPKAIEVGPAGIAAHLWSSHGGRLLDLRTSALADYYGRDWLDSKLPGGISRFLSMSSEAGGTARTHDLTVHLFRNDPARGDEIAAEAAMTDTPPLAVQDPAWLRETLALGPLAPHDPGRFPRAEKYIENFFRMNLLDQASEWGDYGFLDFGIWPHTYNWGPQDPRRGAPLLYRYANLAYGFESTVWLLLARSGDRRYYDYAVAMNRARMDYAYIQHALPGRPLGAFLNSDTSVATPMAWAGAPSFYGSQGSEVDHFFYDYYLTGNRRGVDVASLFKEHALARFDPGSLDRVKADTTVPYIMLLSLYQHDWDPRLGPVIRQVRERNVDPRTDTGLADHDYYGAHYKINTHLRGLLKDYMVTRDPQLLPALRKGLTYLLQRAPDGAMGYQDHSGLFYLTGHRLFDDPRFAAWGAERLARILGQNSDASGRVIGWPYTGVHSPQGLETVVYGMELLRSTPLDPATSAVPLLGLADARSPRGQVRGTRLLDASFPVTFHAIKRIREPLEFHVATTAHPEIILRQADERPGSNTAPGQYFAGPLHLDLRLDYYATNPPGLTGGYGALRLPLEALAGQYELRGIEQVLATDADKLVLVARRGLFIDGRRAPAVPWYIPVPAGRSGAIYTTAPAMLRDGDHALRTLPGQWHDIPKRDSDRVLQLLPTDMTFVRLAGTVPAVLTTLDPERLFLPAGVDLTPAVLADPLDPQQAWTGGLTDEPGDEAWLLAPGRSLSLPMTARGAEPADAAAPLIDPRAGTIEFWFRPQWTSPMQIQDFDPLVVSAGGWYLQYHNQVEPRNPYADYNARRSSFAFAIPGAPGAPRKQVWLDAPLEQGRWYHFAACWIQTRDGWHCELYINGQPSGASSLADHGAADRELPLAVAPPATGRPLLFHGEFAAAIDNIRLSRVVRYGGPFTPHRAAVVPDRHTSLLLRLDGTADPVQASAPSAAASMEEVDTHER